MGIFDRFKKEDDSVLPSEVDDYYKSELKTRRSSSVAMALLALLVTLVVAAGLFFGVRAIYRTLNKDDSSGKTSQEIKKQEEQKAVTPVDEKPSATDDSETNNTGSTDQTDSSSSTNDGSANSSPTPSAGDNIPATGDNPSDLPATGDEGQ